MKGLYRLLRIAPEDVYLPGSLLARFAAVALFPASGACEPARMIAAVITKRTFVRRRDRWGNRFAECVGLLLRHLSSIYTIGIVRSPRVYCSRQLRTSASVNIGRLDHGTLQYGPLYWTKIPGHIKTYTFDQICYDLGG